MSLAGLKTVILVPQFFREGATRQALLLARELKAHHGANVEVWALFYAGEWQQEFEKAGIPTHVLGFMRPLCPIRLVRNGYWVARLFDIVRQLRKHRVDVLLPMTSWPNVIAGLTYRRAGVRLCIWGERAAGIERVPLERFALRQYRSFVANSAAGIDFLTGEMSVDRGLVFYIPNAVEEPQCPVRVEWRDWLGISSAQPVVLKVANVAHQRDHATLIHAWKIIQDAWQGDAKPVLVLAGALGDSFRDVQRSIRTAEMEANVRFAGVVQDVVPLIEASDLCVFSSRKEGMPNSVLECMAAGKPVVATDLPGIREAMGPNSSEVLVPPGDAGALASRILDLLRDAKRLRVLGETNQRRALSEFTVGRMTQAYVDAIEQQLRSLRAATKPKAAQAAEETRSYSA